MKILAFPNGPRDCRSFCWAPASALAERGPFAVRSQGQAEVDDRAGVLDVDGAEAEALVEGQRRGVLADHADVHPGRAGLRYGGAEGVDERAAVPGPLVGRP